MKKICILLFISLNSFAQDKDSLLKVIKNYKLKDTLQCRRLQQLIELENDEKVWMKYNAILGQISSQKLRTNISEKEKEVYFQAYGGYNNNLGFYFTDNAQYDNALLYYKKAIVFYKKSNSLSDLAITFGNMGICCIKKGEPQQYIYFYNQAFDIYKQTGDSLGMANVYADLGFSYADNGSESKALEYFVKSMKISDLIGNKKSKNRAVEYMVRTLKNQNENQKAIEYLNQLVKYYQEVDDQESLGLTYFTVASTYNALGDFKKMFDYSAKSISISEKINIFNTIAANYGLLAKHFLTHNQLDSAYKYSNLEMEFREKKIKEPAYTKSLIRYVNILNLKKMNSKAKELGHLAYQKAESLGSPELVMQSAKNLKRVYKSLNMPSLAFQYAEIEIKMKDSLNAINTKNSAIKALFKYETDAKDNELIKISQQQQISKLESTRKTTLIYSILGGILALSIIAYFSFTRFRTKKENELLSTQLQEAERRIEIEQKATESELKALKSQMNPHFMFNALNGIQEQFMYGDKTVANEQMGNFTYLTRQILTVSGKKKINLSTEVEILTKYLELEKMRFAEGFYYAINLSENIDEDYHQLPPMLIQPFVENSIKHGLLHKQGDKKVSISFDLDEKEENLICVVEDNGVGREKSAEIKSKQIQQHESFSTSATEERLRLLGNNLNGKDLVVYEDLKNEQQEVIGTRVVITIAL